MSMKSGLLLAVILLAACGQPAPYEPPASPELAVDTANHSIEDCVAQILNYVEGAFALASAAKRGAAGAEEAESAPDNGC